VLKVEDKTDEDGPLVFGRKERKNRLGARLVQNIFFTLAGPVDSSSAMNWFQTEASHSGRCGLGSNCILCLSVLKGY
jgi:hypothetical protein